MPDIVIVQQKGVETAGRESLGPTSPHSKIGAQYLGEGPPVGQQAFSFTVQQSGHPAEAGDKVRKVGVGAGNHAVAFAVESTDHTPFAPGAVAGQRAGNNRRIGA